MKVLIVYAHPSEDSFTSKIRDEFIKGLITGNHTYEISDLYKMNFKTDISEAEYLREAYYRDDLPVEDDVHKEQQKLIKCDAVVLYTLFSGQKHLQNLSAGLTGSGQSDLLMEKTEK